MKNSKRVRSRRTNRPGSVSFSNLIGMGSTGLLEPRVMLAGDIAAHEPPAMECSEGTNQLAAGNPSSHQAVPSQKLVLVDPSVEDIGKLLDGIEDAEVVLLNHDQNGIRQITEILSTRSGISELHLISHGAAGELQIANQSIDIDDLHQHRESIKSWSSALNDGADILLYGCDTGSGKRGTAFVETLAKISGKDVAASIDKTGRNSSHSNWQLELQSGKIESSVIVAQQAKENYQHQLTIEIRAAGQTGDESMRLWIDGEAVAQWDSIGGHVRKRQFETYVFETDQNLRPNQVRVEFINDLYQPPVLDRNLRIDSISINGVAYQTEDSNVLSTGTWTKESGISTDYHQTEWLHANGFFQYAADVRTFDGSGNHLDDYDRGATHEELVRISEADYEDGVSAPAGEDRPSAREISNGIVADQSEQLGNSRGLSTMTHVWGQFIDHDLDLTEPPKEGGEALPIEVPNGDPIFDPHGTGEATLGFTRSAFKEGTDADNPRQHENELSAFLDGSMVYGSSTATADALRSFESGKLKTSEGDLLPTDERGFFLAGDVRAMENVSLTAMHTLFVREHNYWAEHFAIENPDWNDEQIYQAARNVVIAEIQAITYNEFLPALLGGVGVGYDTGYDENVNPGIATEFSTAAFRFGHTMLNDHVGFMNDNGTEFAADRDLSEAFFNPYLLSEYGIDSSLKFAASIQAQEIDNQIVDSLRNFLFIGVEEAGGGVQGLDLASLNIQRGRDHGIADYNTVREAYGLERVHDFSDITSDTDVQEKLRSLYGSVDNIDLWVGGLAEDHVAEGSLGETFHTIVSDQFERIRSGDRLWYERSMNAQWVDQINATKLSTIMQRNTDLWQVQEDVFRMWGTIEGVVTSRRGQPLESVTVDLYNEEGTKIATTKTDSHGRYCFDQVTRVGAYRVFIENQAKPEKSVYQDVWYSEGNIAKHNVNLELSRRRGGRYWVAKT